MTEYRGCELPEDLWYDPGVTAQTKDPSVGVIYRKPGTQEPTGLLRDNAMDLVDKLIPPPSDAEEAAARRAPDRAGETPAAPEGEGGRHGPLRLPRPPR